MRKYLRLLTVFFRTSLIADMEYRVNLLVKFFSDVIWYIAQLSFFEVLFTHSQNLGGWSVDSMRVFLGVLFVTDSIWMLFFHENMDHFGERVRKGDLDLLLSKPVNSQFMLSVQRINTAYILNFILTVGWLLWSLDRLPGDFAWERLLTLLVMIPCSLSIIYGMRFFFTSTAVFFTRSESFNYVWYQLYRLGTRPDSLYPPYIRYAILSVLPVAFIASIPSRVLLEEFDWTWMAAAIAIAIVFLSFARWFWGIALKNYSSASS